ncbi:MAG: hypothetical protein ACREDA_03035, partial [Methylocella sp.]
MASSINGRGKARVRASQRTSATITPICSAQSELVEDCPARDTGAALTMPYAETFAMQAHIEEISRHVRA